MAKLIVLEGVDGCGKSTQITRLYNKLMEDGYRIRTIQQPSGTNLVGFLRDEVKNNTVYNPFERQLLHTLSHVTDAFCDFQHGDDVILMDRCHISTMAYGTVTGITAEKLKLLFDIHKNVYDHVLSENNISVSIVFLERDTSYRQDADDNFEKTFDRSVLASHYKGMYDYFLNNEKKDHVFNISEKIFRLNVGNLTPGEVTEEILRMVF